MKNLDIFIENFVMEHEKCSRDKAKKIIKDMEKTN